MSMKTTRLRHYWSAEEAWTVIEMLDRLREALWEGYGEDITHMMRNGSSDEKHDHAQQEIQRQLSAGLNRR